MTQLAPVAVLILSFVGMFFLLSQKTREIALGLVVLSNGVNLLILLTSGSPDNFQPPLLDAPSSTPFVDPLPQALVLTAIVIGYGFLSILLFFLTTLNHEEQ